MFNFLTNFNQDNLSRIKEQVQQINNLEKEISLLTEQEIKEKINQLIKQYVKEQNLDNILCQSFALTREASKRVLGLRHFDTQLMGGIVLHNGKIAEMKTGEGKTLVATLPVVLNALTLKGVHIITVNDYLAKRDKQLMSQLYTYLGLSVGLIQENMDSNERRKNYLADITYVTNSEIAFDYLRDNMCESLNDVVLRSLNYAIIDEVDSILIDEARTPLIITGSQNIPIEKYIIADEISNYLKPKKDYSIDEKAKIVTLTNKGITQVLKFLNISTLYDTNNPWIPYIDNAIRAKNLFLKEKDYIVRNNEIIIVDEFTGRVMADRRWGDGLHQAIEAKEKVEIKLGSEILGSVTYQNFFLLYAKFGGMTGTAKTAEVEFEKIYKQNVIVLPTSQPMIRKDLTDLVYKDEFTKWQAIAEEIYNLNRFGRPILIGTTTIEKSELISNLLKNRKVKHRLLNAKPENIKLESEIIAQAGKQYAVTVSTNMAGRGTDILLGGNPDFQTRKNIFYFIQNLKDKKSNFFINFIKFIKIINLKDLNNFAFSSFVGTSFKCFHVSKIYIKELNTLIAIGKIFKVYKTFGFNLNMVCKVSNKLSYYNELKIENLLINIQENGYINPHNPIDLYLQTLYQYFFEKNKISCNIEKKIIKNLGGLYVIGTERHESRRIDNQLRGRAGRQGDPGASRFFLSLDDDLFRIFGGPQIKQQINKFEFSDNTPLESRFLSKTLDKAQKKVEEYYYDTRKRLFDYDKILNQQRISMYTERRALLSYRSIRPEIISYGETLSWALGRNLIKYKNANMRIHFNELNKEISYLFSLPYLVADFDNSEKNLSNLLINEFWTLYDSKEADFEHYSPGLIRLIEKNTLLNEIDESWKKHLQQADSLRETIGWRSYGQLDPLREYQREGFNLFLETIDEIKYNSVYGMIKTYIK